jgi:molybdopterin/thiamine biosynthesis adenylyltransferase
MSKLEMFLGPEPVLPATVERLLSDAPGAETALSLRGASVLLVGAGNIGTWAAQLLARCGPRQLRIIDQDGVERGNLLSQCYRPSDIGQSKAHALGRQIRQDCPGVRVESYAVALEDLPLGLIHGVDIAVGALDSRRARQTLVSDMAWPRRIRVVEGGVGVTDGLIGRVQAFQPGPHAACLECTYSPANYRALAQEYPCQGKSRPATPPTRAPAFLGCAVGSVLVTEAVRLWNGRAPEGSYEVVFDLWSCRMLRSRLRRSPSCRFDHVLVDELIPLGRPFEEATAADLLAAVDRALPGQAAHLECRRGLRLVEPAARFVSLAALKSLGDAPLATLGLTPADRIRVQAENGSGAFVVCNSPVTRAEEYR